MRASLDSGGPAHAEPGLAAVVRRTADIALAALLLIALSPVLLAAALAIVVVSPGSPLFAQVREGRGGRPFRMWKLRTMHHDADARLTALLQRDADRRLEWERHFRIANDPRVLPVVGRVLRRWSLDEAPQLWNVLRGEMSVVGPRPLPADNLRALRPEYRALRNRVRPGLTGLWQVSGRGETDMRELEELDARYVLSRSLRLDLRILLATPAAVLGGHGAY